MTHQPKSVCSVLRGNFGAFVGIDIKRALHEVTKGKSIFRTTKIFFVYR